MYIEKEQISFTVQVMKWKQENGKVQRVSPYYFQNNPKVHSNLISLYNVEILRRRNIKLITNRTAEPFRKEF